MSIKLNKWGHEPLIDYLKAICIIMVVISHGTGEARDVLLYPFWIDQAVPIFLMIQVFHAYKRDTVNYPSFSKLWSRIMKPFLAIQCLMVVFYLIRYFLKNEDFTENMLLLVKNGGHGPGSYYIWIYLQFSIILPLFTKLVKKRYAAAYFIGCSIGIEIICSYIDMPDYIYRLLFLRFFFLVYVGYLWVKRGIVLNKINILLSIISITAIGLLYYGKSFGLTGEYEPLVFTTDWTIFHWFSYFLPWSFLSFFICRSYKKVEGTKIGAILLLAGKRSFEIFLFQMLVFQVSPLPSYINIILCILPLAVYERATIKNIIFYK